MKSGISGAVVKTSDPRSSDKDSVLSLCQEVSIAIGAGFGFFGLFSWLIGLPPDQTKQLALMSAFFFVLGATSHFVQWLLRK